MAYTQTQWENDTLDAYLDGPDAEEAKPIIYRCEYTGNWKHGETHRFLSPEQAMKVLRQDDSDRPKWGLMKEVQEDMDYKKKWGI